MFDLFRSSHRRGRRRLPALVAALAVAATVTGCDPGPPVPENPPYWLPGTTVDAVNFGPLVHISWDAPQGGDPVAAYQINLGTYNGTGVALVPASVRSCFITGLAASTAYTIVVTARDAQMHWSGPLPGTQGNRTTTITTAQHGTSTGTPWCHAGTDADGDNDGLPDVFETGDGTYASVVDTGTDPNVADTDNDGISDGDETLGRAGLNLIAMGARPTHKDLLIETDWIDGASCAIEPTAAKLAPMVTAFADAPVGKVTNPDGAQGINVIVDYGQGGHFTGGNEIPDTDGTLDGKFTDQPGTISTAFMAARAAHFDPVREGIFHYSVTFSTWGRSASLGQNTYVSGHCEHPNPGPLAYPRTLMHEVGHSLGLYHGGSSSIPSNHPHLDTYPGLAWLICEEPVDPADPVCTSKKDINHKPNYVSVMNYDYPFGVNDSCTLDPTLSGPMWLDYSDGSRATIDENAVDETIGICNGIDADFNHNGIIETTPYRGDINGGDGDGYYTPLHDHDDWTHINEVGLAFIGPD